ncbi:tetratricopeptide repeat protein [Myxosarcina sp. GI1]|uniref:tetratricopeptide repeat protein n=1 Tax=Myxosarcina sp. GI1 TaxID=1541065 RepID=UPI0006912005|nr:tetratricopeptide repeat protein [Myxosarcina sp. GI1]
MQLEQAEIVFQETANFEPKTAEDYYNLGTMLQARQVEAAQAAYQKAISLEPKHAEAHNNLGTILQEKGEIEAAIASYRTAISLQPEYAEAYYNLGTALKEQGQIEAALTAYQKALDLKPDYHFAKVGIAIAQLPVIYSSSKEIERRRSNYRQHLQNLANYYQLTDDRERAEAAATVGFRQPFYLAYQGLNDRDLQQTYGSMIHQLMTSRYPQWGQPLSIPKLAASQRIRIGFVSGFFNHHSVWKIPLQGWIENLDRSEFELFGYYTGSRRDRVTTRAAKAFDRFEADFLSVAQWAEQIVKDKLQVLVFPEFGMDPIAAQLGCLRLAPVQIAFGGHPETSGLPTIDYHLTSNLMEPANAREHYTEQLIRLPNLAVCYQPLPIQPEAIDRADIGIAENEIMFWCCQSLFKYLPQHDDVFPRIAKELTDCKFVFIAHESEFATNVFRQRLVRAFQEFELACEDYCLFLPRLNSYAFAGITAIADVFLDNIGWSGNNTTMESTVFDLPIVTLPGDLMRGRHTMAILKRMGIEETIANSKKEYIEIAVRLGKDASYRQYISQKIALNKHKLYDDLKPVRALEDFLLSLFDKPRYSNKKIAKAFQLAVRHHQANRLEAAQQQYIKVLEAQPEHADALYGLGILAQQIGESEAAEQYLKAAVKLRSQFLKAWFSLGNVCQSRGQLTTAEQAYRQALNLQNNSAPICNNLGYVLQQQNKWQEAAYYYKKALEIQPNCTEADVNLGNALFAQGQLSPEQQVHYADLNFKLGLSRQQVGDWHTAVIYYQQAVSMQPDLVDARYHLGLVLQHQRKLVKATAAYQEVIRLNPEYELAYYSLGETYQDLGNLSQATATFRQGLKLINSDYALAIESHQHEATFAENFTIPQIPQGEVTIGAYQFPVIPKVPVSEEKRPFWSVVIPVVNRPEYFPECLASVLAQWTQEDMEIIVLDNGSEPPQWEIPSELGKGIVRYYRFPKTVSLQENWNTAVSLCRGQWIHLLHHDDYVLPEFYERLQASLSTCSESVGAAFTAHQIINEKRQILYTERHELENYRGIVRDWIRQIGVVNTTSPPSIVIKRAAYEKLGGYKLDILYTCDWELYKRIASVYDWWYEPEVLAHYRQQHNSITIAENTNGASGYDHLRAIEISESYLPEEYRAEITAKSRQNYFYWCLERAKIPLDAGNWNGALQLIEAAMQINHSAEAVAALSTWLQNERAVFLADKLALANIEWFKNKQNAG